MTSSKQAKDKASAKDRAHWNHPGIFLVLALCTILIVMTASPRTQSLQFEVPIKLANRLSPEMLRSVSGPQTMTPSVHAISVVALPEGRLLAAWFGGSREGASDVAIYGSSFDGINWSGERLLIDVNALREQSGQGARKLGNPVLHLDRSGYLHLFVTSVALGGWATSYIEHFRSDDGGKSFKHQRRLWLSSFANLSHLVKAPAVNLKRGGFLLPVYFELGAKHGIELHFDTDSRLVGAKRMIGPGHLLQPWPVVRDENQIDYYFRDGSSQGGRVWMLTRESREPVRPLALRNPDASIAVWPAFDGASWIVRNPDSVGRQQLVLQRLNAQQQVTDTLVIARGGEGDEFSYPALAVTSDGRLHVLYTERRTRFGHRIFRGY